MAIAELRPYDAPPAPRLSALELELVTRMAAGQTVRAAAVELNYSVVYLRKVAGELRLRVGAATSEQLVGIVVGYGLIRIAA